MKEKKISICLRWGAIALMFIGGYFYTKPSASMTPSGFAALDSSIPALDKLTQFDFENEQQEDNGISGEVAYQPMQIAKQQPSKDTSDTKISQDKKQATTTTQHKENEQQEHKVVTKQIITEPEEEIVVRTNHQYIGNSGMVFMTYAEAEAYAKQQMVDYPDTTQSYTIKESWEYPVDGSLQYTVDFTFVS